MYRDEYSECTSIRGRFQQYFIYGQTIDCSQWKRDLDNCEKWMDSKDIISAVIIYLTNKTYAIFLTILIYYRRRLLTVKRLEDMIV